MAPAPVGTKWGYVNRVNRVPYYQRLFQRNDGIRQWNKTPKSRILTLPFYASVSLGAAASLYMMLRLTFGHKKWFAKG